MTVSIGKRTDYNCDATDHYGMLLLKEAEAL